MLYCHFISADVPMYSAKIVLITTKAYYSCMSIDSNNSGLCAQNYTIQLVTVTFILTYVVYVHMYAQSTF